MSLPDTAPRRPRLAEWLITLPSLGWLLLLFLLPTLLIFGIALRPPDPFGGIGPGFTLSSLAGLRNPSYPAIIWRTLWLSLVTTFVSILLAAPAGYTIARTPRRWRQVLLLLVIVPFWTSFLVRIFAWKTLLHPEGILKRVLVALGLSTPGTSLLYNSEAVLLVMIYTYLPFAILPIYAAAERFDFRLIEAARDLGALPFQAFLSVFLPGIRRGLLTATLVIFIPALGSYVIPDLVGGPGGEMVGNKIAQRVFVDRNLPHASALSSLLVLAVLLPMAAVLTLQGRRTGAGPIIEEDA